VTEQVLLLVATPGGHLHELVQLAQRMPGNSRVWITARTSQSEALLRGERVEYVQPVGSRQALRAVQSIAGASALLKRHDARMVVSTGAALCVPYMVAARARGLPAHYIESATRVDDISVSARLLTRVPGVRMYHQGLREAPSDWTSTGSVFDGFAARRGSGSVNRVLVTLGSERFPFARMIDMVRRILPLGTDVVWQTGHTSVPRDLPGRVVPWMSFTDMATQMARADVVVTHAGVGSVLAALDQGRVPLVLPRERRLGEHVDDHQSALVSLLRHRGLAVQLTNSTATSDKILEQMAGACVDRSMVTPIVLDTAATRKWRH